MNAGKWVIIGMFAVALLAGSSAWVHRYYQTDEVQPHWGTRRLRLIAGAPQITGIVRLGEGESKRVEITRAKGIINIRHMLGLDVTYDDLGTVGPPSLSPPLPWAMEFSDGSDSVVFGFSHDCRFVLDEATAESAQLSTAAAANLRSFFDEQFPKESAAVDKSGNERTSTRN